MIILHIVSIGTLFLDFIYASEGDKIARIDSSLQAETILELRSGMWFYISYVIFYYLLYTYFLFDIFVIYLFCFL